MVTKGLFVCLLLRGKLLYGANALGYGANALGGPHSPQMSTSSLLARVAGNVPALLGCLLASAFLYWGVQGIRGKDILLVGRFGFTTTTISGSNARVLGAVFLFVGFFVGWASLLSL